MKKTNILLAVILVFLLAGCASKRYYKQALKLDNAGLYTNAAGLYYQSVVKSKKNVEASLGLQRTGQMVLDDKIAVFKKQYDNGIAEEAVHAYLDAESYYNKINGVGIKLILPEEQKAYYDEVKDVFLNKKYQEAIKKLDLEQFSTAQYLFAEILKVDKSYKDSKSKWITAKYEPIYRKGKEQFNARLFRSAYFSFDKVVRGANLYKNSIALKTNALDSATITIVSAPVAYAHQSYQATANQLKTKTIQKITTINSPFYQLISESTVVSVPTWSKLSGPTKAIQLAKVNKNNFEAKAVLGTSLDYFSLHSGKVKKTTKRGYLKVSKQVLNKQSNLKETQITYKKVEYYEYTVENKASIKVSFSLSRIDKNELAFSNSYKKESADKAHYATFEGNYKDLIPGYWDNKLKASAKDRRDDSESSIATLHRLFKQSKKVKPASQLKESLLIDCSKRIVRDIEKYQPEN